MFKYGSVEDEIYRSMEKKLVAKQVEDSHGFSKLARAADYLNAAAEVFDNAGMHEQAAEVTEVLQELAKQLSGKTSSFEGK
jgi:thiamine pyrophosphate-dependent acetolactate synthase large subunit-like protein